MFLRWRTFLKWIRKNQQADIIAIIGLLFIAIIYLSLTNNHYPLSDDQALYLSVTNRVLSGEVLYKDVWWIFPPLPVFVLGLFFRLIGIKITALLWMGFILAILACLLTYRIARFLLPAPWAFLGTCVAFLGEVSYFNGGFLTYIYTYSGGVSLGGVCGLLFVLCLLYYLKHTNPVWLTIAGLATGGCCLSKPEFAFASISTGLLFLTWISFFPSGLSLTRRHVLRAWIAYILSAGVITAIGYGYVTVQAGWQNVWAGISGYGIPLSIYSPAWGTILSWIYIISGSGIYLLLAAAFLRAALFRIDNKSTRLLGALLISGTGLFIIPWGFLPLYSSDAISWIVTGKSSLLKLGIQLCSAPETLLLSCLVIILGYRWFTYHNKYSIDRRELILALILIYSGFAAARSFFNPLQELSSLYKDTLVPGLIFIAIEIIPPLVEKRLNVGLHLWRWQTLIVILSCTVVTAGFLLAKNNIAQLDYPLTTLRGTIFTSSPQPDWIATYQFITQHTQVGDPIVILNDNPELDFLSLRSNPLRQEYFHPYIYFSPEEVNDIIWRLKTSRPRLIIARCWVTNSQAVLSGSTSIQPKEWAKYQPSLAPVWQYVTDNYQVSAVFNPTGWGFVVFEPHKSKP